MSRTAWRVALPALALGLAGALAGCGDDDLDPACTAPSGVRCDGAAIVTCVGEEVTRQDCGEQGLECGYVGGAAPAACVADACGTIGPRGACVDGRLVQCTDGALAETSCDDGLVCGWVDDATGHGCRAAATAVVRGRIVYEDRPQTGRGPVGDIQILPVRGATVTVVDDATMQVLATATTADNGTYAVHYEPPAGMVHVTAVARSTFAPRPITVVGNGGAVHGFGSPSFAAGGDASVDVVITAATAAEAFNVFDQTVTGMDVLTGELGVAAPSPLKLTWYRGSRNGTYYAGGSGIFLLGDASDDDGYDDTVIQHEIGHYVEHTVGRSDSPGGGHDGRPTDPRLAWSEGYATFWACAADGQPVYSDSNSGGGFFDNLDTGLTRATGSGLSQPVSENMVSQILWDIADAPAPDDDMMTTSNGTEVNAVQRMYLKSATLRSVGTAGVDLVDFLDGWFVTRGLGSCAAVRDIVVTKRNFPYDFGGPAGACP